jgi:hypothetical protein
MMKMEMGKMDKMVNKGNEQDEQGKMNKDNMETIKMIHPERVDSVHTNLLSKISKNACLLYQLPKKARNRNIKL